MPPLRIQPGMTFGDWTVIERDYHPTSKQHSTFWFCKCEICGEIYSVSRDSLVKGSSSCCNHCKGIKIREKAIERGLTSWSIGDRYGMLEIIGRGTPKGNHIYVKCRCDCGTEKEIRLEHLKGQCRKGATISCGCASESSGELKIRQLLEQHNIVFQTQYRIKDFNYNAPFDFALFNNKEQLIGLIEYDGAQHFFPVEFFGGEEKFQQQQENDNNKNEWCANNNIHLERIPYTDYNKIDIGYLYNIFPELQIS